MNSLKYRPADGVNEVNRLATKVEKIILTTNKTKKKITA